MVSASLGKLKQLVLAERGQGQTNQFPGVKSNVIFQSLNHPAGSVCVQSLPVCHGACGTTMPVTPPCP